MKMQFIYKVKIFAVKMKTALLGVAVVLALMAAYMNEKVIRRSLADNLLGKWEVYYFHAQGKAQAIRYVYDYLNVNFTDTRATQDYWDRSV